MPESTIGWMTSSVQIGFILGTLVFSILTIADRYPPKLIFLYSSLLAALSNAVIVWVHYPSLEVIMIARFGTGFFLAGIYPVGMKIAAGWYQKGLGKALGYLVGALVLGTAFPHFLRGVGAELTWQLVITLVSILASFGGLLMFVGVGEGPFSSKGAKLDWRSLAKVFKVQEFRLAAFGYFGHMWELYAMWTFVPFLLVAYPFGEGFQINISLWSFVIISVGTLGCVVGGYMSKALGSSTVAMVMLGISGLCCLLSPWFFDIVPAAFLTLMTLWGFSVVGDSPQFSTLSALTAPNQLVGTGLTIVTSIGFAITIFSIELLNHLRLIIPVEFLFLPLIPGPILGLWAMKSLRKLEDQRKVTFSQE